MNSELQNWNLIQYNDMIPENLIINADDFGLDEKKNAAIAACFARGIINSASVMTNMGAFEDGLLIAREYGFMDRLGLHACLTEGRPVTDLSGTMLVDEEGRFDKERVYHPAAFLSPKVRRAVEREIGAQLNLLYDHGVKPTHINSHHHVHTLPWLAGAFLKIARKHKIKIRIAQTWNKGDSKLKPFYRRLLNAWYESNKLRFSNYFETMESFQRMSPEEKDQAGRIEIMVHPDIDTGGSIYDCFDGKKLEQDIAAIIL